MAIPTVDNIDETRIPTEGSATFRSDASYVWSALPNVITSLNSALAEFNAQALLDGGTTYTAEYLDTGYKEKFNTGFKNYIINGGFDVWQRGESFTDGGIVADRWQFRGLASVGGTVTISKQTDPNSMSYYEAIHSGATSLAYISQRIENPHLLSGKTVTLSFMSYATVSYTATVWFTININGISTAVSSDYTHSTLSGWQKNIITVTLPTTSETVITTSDYLALQLNYGDSVLADGTYRFAQIQLEEGSVATPFEQRPYGLELSLCQRHYWNITSGATAIGTGTMYTDIDGRCVIKHPVIMRDVPDFSIGNLADVRVQTTLSVTPTGYSVIYASESSVWIQLTSSALVAGDACTTYVVTGGNANIEFNAEL